MSGRFFRHGRDALNSMCAASGRRRCAADDNSSLQRLDATPFTAKPLARLARNGRVKERIYSLPPKAHLSNSD